MIILQILEAIFTFFYQVGMGAIMAIVAIVGFSLLVLSILIIVAFIKEMIIKPIKAKIKKK